MLITLLILTVDAAAQVRVVAVGDLHGAYPEFVAILQRVGLVGANRQWIGGSSVLVQAGDVIDRGNGSRQCLELLMDLERQAPKQNGRVIPLLGNHEVMNLMGDLRYVVPEDYRAFATDESEKRREEAYRDYRNFFTSHSAHHHTQYSDDDAGRQKWMADHPPGFFERHDAFEAQGRYGHWIRSHVAVVQVGDVLFVHGGLNPAMDFKTIEELNERVQSEIARFDSLWQSLCEKKIIWRYMKLDEAFRQMQEEWMWIQARGQVEDPEAVQQMKELSGVQNWLILSPDGPLWYRGLALEPEEKLKAPVEAMLARLKVRYIVAAHTVVPKHDIWPRFDNHVFLIDTGMLKEVFDGRGSALEFRNGGVTAYYTDGQPQVLVAPSVGATNPASGHE
ncbi:MAG: metallophosphoesterase [Terriglobia bacterium]|jgi:hypothetical protein